MSDPKEEPKIIVDEDWKSQVQAEKEALKKEEPPAAETAESAQPQAEGDLPPLPPASFSGLVMMLATQSSMLLQEASDPAAENRNAQLEHAKHFIDMLAVLQEKTAGNLDAEEAMALENVLHELRMAHVSLRG